MTTTVVYSGWASSILPLHSPRHGEAVDSLEKVALNLTASTPWSCSWTDSTFRLCCCSWCQEAGVVCKHRPSAKSAAVSVKRQQLSAAVRAASHPDVRCRGSQHVEYRHSGCQSLDSDYTQTKLSCLHMSVMKTTGNLHRRGLYGNQRCQYSALKIKTECPRAEHFPQTCLHT